MSLRRSTNLALSISMLGCLSAMSAQATGPCIDLGPAKQFNVYVSGDYWGWWSDVEGALGVGGNASLSTYSVGARRSQSTPLSPAFIGGGDLTLYSSAILGNASYRGALLVNTA